MCVLEAEELAKESYGWELLQSIGAQYSARGHQYLVTHHSVFGGGFLGWAQGVKSGASTFGDSISLIRAGTLSYLPPSASRSCELTNPLAGLHLKSVFQKLQDAEKLGLSPEQMRALEEEAAQEGLKTLWKSAKLEVESVIRETCDVLLSDSTASKETLRLRAIGLELVGEAYVAAPKPVEEGQPQPRMDDIKGKA